jgi:ferrous iron transport protein A
LSRAKAIPLASLAPNEAGIVQYLAGGRGLTSRLATLGFTPGARVTMVQNFERGPIIVTVRGTRIALGRGEAQKIIVTPVLEGGK